MLHGDSLDSDFRVSEGLLEVVEVRVETGWRRDHLEQPGSQRLPVTEAKSRFIPVS